MSGGGKQSLESDNVEIDYEQKIESVEFKNLFDIKYNISEEKPSWARELNVRSGVKWNPLSDSSKEWYESTKVLNAEFTAI